MVTDKALSELKEYIPVFKKRNIAILTYLAQLLIFLILMFVFYRITSVSIYNAILGQSVVCIFLSLYYIYIAVRSETIRRKCIAKYGALAGQGFWYRYQFWAIPIISASFYFPLLLKTDYFLPALIDFPKQPLTIPILPWYIAIPSSFALVILGIGISLSSMNVFIDQYLDIIYPEDAELIEDGIYGVVRNPQYLSRGLLSIAFGIFANSLLALIVALIHFVSYIVIIPFEDRYILERIYGERFTRYKSRVPALFPKLASLRRR